MAGAPGHTTVVDVPDNCGLQTFERFLMFENGEGIKQCLRGMLVHAVARVDDWNVEVPRHQVWSAGGRMPKYDGICPDCPQRVAGIEEGLAFFDARTRGLHQRSHGTQGFRGEFE